MTRIVGANNRYVAEVDDTNRLLTRTVSKDDSIDAIQRGDGYVLRTADITLTDATESAVLLFQNDEDRDVIAIGVACSIADSTGGTTDTVEVVTYLGTDLTMVGGTGSPLDQQNLIIGNPSQVDSTSEKGQQGASITGGTVNRRYAKTGATVDDEVFAVFPKGSAFAFAIKPPTGNTSMVVNVTVSLYLEKSL